MFSHDDNYSCFFFCTGETQDSNKLGQLSAEEIEFTI